MIVLAQNITHIKQTHCRLRLLQLFLQLPLKLCQQALRFFKLKLCQVAVNQTDHESRHSLLGYIGFGLLEDFNSTFKQLNWLLWIHYFGKSHLTFSVLDTVFAVHLFSQ